MPASPAQLKSEGYVVSGTMRQAQRRSLIFLQRRIGLYILRRLGEVKEPLHRVQILAGLAVEGIGGLEGLDRIVQELVDDAAGEFLEVLALGGGDLAQLVDGSADFFLGDLVVALVELVDERAKLAGAVPGDEFLELLVDDLSGGGA